MGGEEEAGHEVVDMSDEIVVPFAGPFSWPGTPDAQSVFDVDEGSGNGIYLWTVPLADGHLVYYVGETGRPFAHRLFEHYKEHAAATCPVWSPAEFARGEKIALWAGCSNFKECVANYSRLSEPILTMTYTLRFLLAPLSFSARIRRRIEGAISRSLGDEQGIVGSFQLRVQPRPRSLKDEQPIACVVNSPVRILGLREGFSA